jgi:hypothetical protein
MPLRQRRRPGRGGLQLPCADGPGPQESMMLRPTLVTVQRVFFSQGYVGYRLKTAWRPARGDVYARARDARIRAQECARGAGVAIGNG